MRWVNRPTFQQVVSFGEREPGGLDRRQRLAEQSEPDPDARAEQKEQDRQEDDDRKQQDVDE